MQHNVTKNVEYKQYHIYYLSPSGGRYLLPTGVVADHFVERHETFEMGDVAAATIVCLVDSIMFDDAAFNSVVVQHRQRIRS